jgi:hypothetical protein
MDSNITKVSKLCSKITMDIQESDTESDKAKSILADLCDAVKTLSQVQGEIVKRLYSTEENIQSTYEGKSSYSAVAAANSKSAGPSQPTHTRRLPVGGLVKMSMDKQGKPAQVIKETEEVTESPEEAKSISLRKLLRTLKDPPFASTWTWAMCHCRTR